MAPPGHQASKGNNNNDKNISVLIKKEPEVRLDDDEKLLMIQRVGQYRLIWDPHHPEHSRGPTIEAFKQICMEMSAATGRNHYTVELLKYSWRCLCIYFRKLIREQYFYNDRKNNSSSPSGSQSAASPSASMLAVAGSFNQSNQQQQQQVAWRFFEPMQFLLPIIMEETAAERNGGGGGAVGGRKEKTTVKRERADEGAPMPFDKDGSQDNEEERHHYLLEMDVAEEEQRLLLDQSNISLMDAEEGDCMQNGTNGNNTANNHDYSSDDPFEHFYGIGQQQLQPKHHLREGKEKAENAAMAQLLNGVETLTNCGGTMETDEIQSLLKACSTSSSNTNTEALLLQSQSMAKILADKANEAARKMFNGSAAPGGKVNSSSSLPFRKLMQQHKIHPSLGGRQFVSPTRPSTSSSSNATIVSNNRRHHGGGGGVGGSLPRNSSTPQKKQQRERGGGGENDSSHRSKSSVVQVQPLGWGDSEGQQTSTGFIEQLFAGATPPKRKKHNNNETLVEQQQQQHNQSLLDMSVEEQQQHAGTGNNTIICNNNNNVPSVRENNNHQEQEEEENLLVQLSNSFAASLSQSQQQQHHPTNSGTPSVLGGGPIRQFDQSDFFGMHVASVHRKLQAREDMAELAVDFQEAVMTQLFAFERRAIRLQQEKKKKACAANDSINNDGNGDDDEDDAANNGASDD